MLLVLALTYGKYSVFVAKVFSTVFIVRCVIITLHNYTRSNSCLGALSLLLGLWLRLECSFDSLSIDPAHVIYLAEGHNVGSERQSSVMTLRKPIVTWII